MVKLVTVAAISGTWLIAYSLWKRYRQSESLRVVADEGARTRKYVSPLEFARLDELANGKPQRLLNVNNFGLEELEVRVVWWGRSVVAAARARVLRRVRPTIVHDLHLPHRARPHHQITSAVAVSVWNLLATSETGACASCECAGLVQAFETSIGRVASLRCEHACAAAFALRSRHSNQRRARRAKLPRWP